MLEFAELLKAHLNAAGMNVSQLAREAGLPRRTIANWLEGYAQKPRYWSDVLKLAGGMRLDRLATDDLLVSAGFPTTNALRARYPEHHLLHAWADAGLADAVGQRVVEIIGESGGAIFEGLPFAKAVYLMEQTVQLAEVLGDTRRCCLLAVDLARCLMTLARYQAAADALLRAIELGQHTEQSEIVLEARCLLLSLQALARTDKLAIEPPQHAIVESLKVPLSSVSRLRALHSLGLWAGCQQRYDEAARYYQQAYQCAATDPLYSGQQIAALNNLGDLAIRQSDYIGAERVLSKALALSIRERAEGAAAYVRTNLGIVNMRCGDYESAETQFEISEGLAIRFEEQAGLFGLHLNRAELALHRHDELRATAEFSVALAMCAEDTFDDLKAPLTYCVERLRKGQGRYLLNDPYYQDMLYMR